jgi:hypothetical protein
MYKNSGDVIVWTGLLAIDWYNGMMLPRYQGNYSLLRCSRSAMNVSLLHSEGASIIQQWAKSKFFLPTIYASFHNTYVLCGIRLSLEEK